MMDDHIINMNDKDIIELINLLESEKNLKLVPQNQQDQHMKNIINLKYENQEYSARVISISNEDKSSVCENKLLSAKQDAQILQSCNHQNIARYISEFQLGQFYIILMENLEQSLKEWQGKLKLQQKIERKLFINLSLQILHAVQYIHSQNYLLRNLTISKIYLDKEMRIKIFDFGAPQELIPSLCSKQFFDSKVNNISFYLPPELIDKSKNYTHRTEKIMQNIEVDIWSVSINLYSLVGAGLFQIKGYTKGDSFFEILLPGADYDIKKLIMNTLWMNPKLRPSISSIVKQFEELEIKQNQSPEEQKIQEEFDKLFGYEDLSIEVVNLIKKGETLYNDECFQESIEILKQVIQVNPKIHDVYYLIGLGYLELKKYDESIYYLKQANMIQPNHPCYLKNIGYIYWSKKQFAEAIPYLNQAIQIFPEYSHGMNLLGCVYQDLENFEKAIEYYKKSSVFNPQHCNPYYNLGNTQQLLDLFEESMISYEKALEVHPYDPQTFNLIGNLFENMMKNTKAIEYYSKGLEINPDQIDSYLKIAFLYTQEPQNLELTVTFLQKAIALDHENLKAYHNLGVAYNNLQKYNLSVLAYKKAIQIDPLDESSYSGLGFVYKTRKLMYDKALKIVQVGLRKIKNNPQYLNINIKYAKKSI